MAFQGPFVVQIFCYGSLDKRQSLISSLVWGKLDIRFQRYNLFMTIRFKALGGTQTQLLSVFQMRIRSTLEFAALVFTSGLTKEQSRVIDIIQRKAFVIILGNQYTSYQSALLTLQQEHLDTRHHNLCYKFVLKCTQSKKHRSMFPLNHNFRKNTRNPKPFKEFYCRTSRYYNSPIQFLARLLSKYADSTKMTSWPTIVFSIYDFSTHMLLVDYEIC